jgi:hypothetical protein
MSIDVSDDRLKAAYENMKGREHLLREYEKHCTRMRSRAGYVAVGFFAFCVLMKLIGVNVQLEAAAIMTFLGWVGSQYFFRPGHFATDYQKAVKEYEELTRMRQLLAERGVKP